MDAFSVEIEVSTVNISMAFILDYDCVSKAKQLMVG